MKKKEYKNVSQRQEIYTYCSMNKQHVGGVQKWEKKYTLRGWLVVLFYGISTLVG